MKKKSSSLTIGIDVGGTFIKSGVVREGRILIHTSVPTAQFKTPAQLQNGLIRMALSLSEKTDGSIQGIGIGVPGLVRYPVGIVHSCANIRGWHDVPLKAILQRKLKWPVFIDNDANLMTLAEWVHGAGRGVDNLVCMTLGTGVGGGLILNGRLYRGSAGWAGEIGHMPVNETGPACACGGKACLERYVGNNDILKRVRRQLRSGVKSRLSDLIQTEGSLTPPLIDRACELGDPLARKTWEKVGVTIGIVCAGVVNLLNPERIVIGGGISKAGRWIFEPLRKTVEQRAMRGLGSVEIVPAKLGSSAGMIGAALLAHGEKVRS